MNNSNMGIPINLTQFDILNNPNAFVNPNLPAQNQGVENVQQPTFWDLPIEEQNKIIGQTQSVQTTEGLSEMDRPDWNLFGNIRKEAERLGTGLTNIYSSLISGELLPEVGNYLANTTGAQKIEDYANAILSGYNLKVDDFGNRSARDIIGGAIQGAYENPISTTLDALSLGGASLLGPAGDFVNKTFGARVIPGLQSSVVENVLNFGNNRAKRKIVKIYDDVKQIDNKNLAELIEAAETGKKVRPELESDFKKLKEFSEGYDNIAKEYSPRTHVDAEELAITQKIARDNNITYARAREELKNYFDINNTTKTGQATIDELAKTEPLAKQFLDAQKLYNEGRIFPITHGLAEVSSDIGPLGARQVLEDSAERQFAGRFSTREWGNATYENIAKQLVQPDEFIESLTRQYLDEYLAKELRDGKLSSDIDININAPKNTMYIRRSDLEAGSDKSVLQALNSASKSKQLDTDIPISTTVLNELKHQLNTQGSIFTGAARDLIDATKGAVLGSGGYLGANFIGGTVNNILNSGVNIIDDVLDAIRSKGRLSQDLGLTQFSTRRPASWELFRVIQNINEYTTGRMFRAADKKMQNIFSEIAAHSELRKRGIPYEKRFSQFDEMNKAELGQLITDIKNTALINSSNTFLPRAASEILSAYNPFWRWLETASKATVRTIEKNPILANTILNDVLANIGFDREMQNRLDLRVSLDKPFVTYKLDPKTGKVRQASADFVPEMTTLRLLAGEGLGSYGASVPFFTALANAWDGKDKYGNLNKRAVKDRSANEAITQIVGTERIKLNPDGSFERIRGQADELLSTAIKELLAPITLYNRTLGPAIAGVAGKVTGQDLHFNQPYAQSLLGDFTDSDINNNFLIGGNMDRQRTGQDVLNQLRGLYEQQYYDENRPLSSNEIFNFWRGYARNYGRRNIQ